MNVAAGTRSTYDAVVVGAGPNGLAAAITLARAGWSVLLVEQAATVGGGMRTEELTLPGFLHDVCSTAHPLAVSSRFFTSVPLERYGVEFVHAPVPLAHPLDGAPAAVLHRDLEATAAALGAPDGAAWRSLFSPLLRDVRPILDAVLGPPPVPPRHPLALARFGLPALRSAEALASARFSGAQARALFAGIAAHAITPLDRLPTGAYGLLLALTAHASGWPLVRGGSRRLAAALAACLAELGGEVVTGWRVGNVDELPPARAVLLDLTPRQVLAVAGHRLPARYRRRLERFRYGPGVFKVDWALDGPVPWRDEACARAAVVHLGGTLEEVAASEAAVAAGAHPRRPFVLAVEASRFDPERAPEGRHTLWTYCHVPNGSRVDMTAGIQAQVERFAPGFGARVLTRAAMDTAAVQAHGPNYVGGDIAGGAPDLRQLFTRPAVRWPVYSTPDPRLWLCSSSTPPGGGVHGMCGVGAAEAVLRRAGARRR